MRKMSDLPLKSKSEKARANKVPIMLKARLTRMPARY